MFTCIVPKLLQYWQKSNNHYVSVVASSQSLTFPELLYSIEDSALTIIGNGFPRCAMYASCRRATNSGTRFSPLNSRQATVS